MKYILRSAEDKRRYYSFAGGDDYDGPQFSTDIRNAKRFSLRGAQSIKGRLASNSWWGEVFEIIEVDE